MLFLHHKRLLIHFLMEPLTSLCPDCRDGQWPGWLTEGDANQPHDKMLARNRFLLLLVVGGVTLAIISLSLQFCEYTICAHVQFSCSAHSLRL